MRRKRPSWVKELARDFIFRLLNLAEKVYRSDPELGKRYIDLVLKASKKYNVRLPREYKRRICKKCHALMIPGYNARIRVTRDSILWICEECGYVKRYGKPEKEGKGSKTTSEDREKRSNRGPDNGDK